MARLKVMAKPRLMLERIQRGYTLEVFSKEIGYSPAGYGKVEIRRNGMRPRGVERILTLLKMEFDDLFEFVDTED